MSWITDTPIAHRGLHNSNIPENSILAFKNAIENGYAIELDVRQTIDGEIIVFHDINLDRMTNINKTVDTQTAKFITSLRLLDSSEFIPTLEDTLRFIDNKVPVLIEIKNNQTCGQFESKLNKILSSYIGEYAIQSFNLYSVRWFSIHNPSVMRGQLSGDFMDDEFPFYKKIILRYLFMNWYSKPNFIAYDIKLLPCWAVWIRYIFGIPVLAWTINSYSKQNKAKKYANNIIFEKIEP